MLFSDRGDWNNSVTDEPAHIMRGVGFEGQKFSSQFAVGGAIA
jgi:hypothetical protein